MAVTEKPTALDPLDFLAIDGLLDDEERAIRDTVRSFVREKVLPNVGDWFEAGDPPARADRGARQARAASACTSTATGCRARAPLPTGSTCLELEAGDSGIRSAVSVQGSLAMYSIWRWGSEEQKQRWLPAMHAGEAIGCFGLTEPDAGSDPGSMRTHARRDGSDWILNGAKMWITNGTIADVAGRLGAHGRRSDPRLPRREGHAGLQRARDPQEALAPRLGHLGARAPGRARAGREHVPGGQHAARAAVVPERGALRDRLGRGRRGARLLRGGARLREGARSSSSKPIAGVPADAAEAGRDGARAEPRARWSRSTSAA